MKVAFLGLGAMGLPMAVTLQRKGFSVTGWNRSPGKGQELAAAGGAVVATVKEAVAGADYVVTMLGGPNSLVEVADGPDGFLAVCKPGVLWIDSSTIGQAAAQAIGMMAASHGVGFVDAPVTGGPVNCAEGTLAFLVGGAEGDVERATPLLNAMGKAIHHFGALGQGAAAKSVNNMMVGTMIAAFAEAVALAEELGIDRAQIVDFLASGAGGAPALKAKAPMIKANEFTPSFQTKWMEKDLSLALRAAANLGFSLPVSCAAHAALGATRQAGHGDEDFASVYTHIRSVIAGRPEGKFE